MPGQVVSTSEVFSTSRLPAGTHLITYTVTDNDGAQTSSTPVTLVVQLAFILATQAGPGGSISPPTGPFAAGSYVTVNEIPNSRYVVASWTIDGVLQTATPPPSMVVHMDMNHTVKVTFKRG